MERKKEIHQYMQKLKKENGAATVVEYTIVLPLCFLVVLFLFLAGYYMNERAVMDAAALRSVLVAQKLYADPKFKVLTELDFSETEDLVGYKRSGAAIEDAPSEPYRFLFGRGGFEEYTRQAVKQKATSCMLNNQLFPLGDGVQNLRVEVSEVEGLLTKRITVTISEDFYFPKFMELIGLEEKYTMQGAATTTLSAQPELIHNIDLVIEIMEDFGLDKYLEKVQVFFKKIGNFVKSLGGDE